MRRVLAAVAAAFVGLGIGAGALWWALTPAPYVNPPLTPLAERADAGEAPNVVLIIGCTVRRDQLTPYGGPETVTPFLAKLASEGAKFEDVIAASSWTKASSVALLTGRHAISVGMVEPKRVRNERALHPSITTLAEYFVDAGYETMGVTGNPNLNSDFGLAQGFDAYRDVDGRIIEVKLSGQDLVDRALQLVDERAAPDRPLFLQAMLVDAHEPRDNLSDDEREAFKTDGVSSELAEYRGQLHRIDLALATLEEGLKSRGIAPENTLWVMVADHGEGLDMPQHHRGHGRTLYPSMVEVPWIVRGPGVTAGTQVQGLASLIDLSRTVTALAGIQGPAHGEDWSGQVGGATPWTTRYLAFSDTWFYETRRSSAWTSSEACQKDFGSTGEGRDDIVFEDGCFDRREDVGFSTPLPPTRLMTELEGWRAARVEEASTFNLSSDATVSGQLSEHLEALGYVD